MNDNQGVTPIRTGNPTAYRLPPRLAIPGPAADPARLAQQVVAALVPAFADAASVFVPEELLSGGALLGVGSLSGDTLSEGTSLAEGAGAGPVGGDEQARLIVRTLAATAVAPGGRPAPGTAFPPGEVVAFDGDSPCARCLRDAAPVIFTQASRSTLQRIAPSAATAAARYASFLTVPMITQGATIGILTLARGHHAPAFDDADTRGAMDLAARAGAAIAGSLALTRRPPAAESVQPPALADGDQPGRLEIAGRCLHAAGAAAGGDWYDIVPLPEDRTGIIVGDVMGHGPRAATVMTRLSAAAFALASLDLPPAEFLHQLNRTALALPQETFATCTYAVIDPVAQYCTLATAGHLPPVLALPDGATRTPGIPAGRFLGIAPATYGQAHMKLRPGTIVCLYTDGLVETRTRSFDQGILALQTAISGTRSPLGTVCDHLAASLGDRREDDITLVLARIPNDPR